MSRTTGQSLRSSRRPGALLRALGLLLLLVAFLGPPHRSQAADLGQFKGAIVVSFLADGRNVKLEQAFGYVDPRGRHWDVPAGAVTDGASIPQVFWVTHPPFTGKYREAAVLHDYYCRARTSSWQEAHALFYDAMRTSGVEERTAKVMFAAVYNFGPRWGENVGRRGPAVASRSVADQRLFMDALDAWVARANPSPGEIAAAIDAGRIPQ